MARLPYPLLLSLWPPYHWKYSWKSQDIDSKAGFLSLRLASSSLKSVVTPRDFRRVSDQEGYYHKKPLLEFWGETTYITTHPSVSRFP